MARANATTPPFWQSCRLDAVSPDSRAGLGGADCGRPESSRCGHLDPGWHERREISRVGGDDAMTAGTLGAADMEGVVDRPAAEPERCHTGQSRSVVRHGQRRRVEEYLHDLHGLHGFALPTRRLRDSRSCRTNAAMSSVAPCGPWCTSTPSSLTRDDPRSAGRMMTPSLVGSISSSLPGAR